MRALLAILPLLAGCAFGPGSGFMELTGVSVSAAIEPNAARDLGGGAVLTDLGYEVAIDEAVLSVTSVTFEELQGAGGATFDPANPPPGYGLCHNGHCHRDDGALIDYADIEAELAGDNATFEPLAEVVVTADLDQLEGDSVSTTDILPTPDLPQGDLRRVQVAIPQFRMSATITHPDTVESVAMSIDLPIGQWTDGFDFTVDRTAPPSARFDVHVSTSGLLFDGIDFLTLADDGALTLNEADDPAAIALMAAMTSATGIDVTLTETE